jgi:hypothetical protein
LAQQGTFSLQAYDSVVHAHPLEQRISSPVGDVVTTMLKDGATRSAAPATWVDGANAAAATITATPCRFRVTRPPFELSADHPGDKLQGSEVDRALGSSSSCSAAGFGLQRPRPHQRSVAPQGRVCMLEHTPVRKCLRLKPVHLTQHIRLSPGTEQYCEDDRSGGRGTADATLAVDEDSAVAPFDCSGETNQAFNIPLRRTAI